jgi:hypothetical protein
MISCKKSTSWTSGPPHEESLKVIHWLFTQEITVIYFLKTLRALMSRKSFRESNEIAKDSQLFLVM